MSGAQQNLVLTSALDSIVADPHIQLGYLNTFDGSIFKMSCTNVVSMCVLTKSQHRNDIMYALCPGPVNFHCTNAILCFIHTLTNGGMPCTRDFTVTVTR